jgi:hypothetical protein
MPPGGPGQMHPQDQQQQGNYMGQMVKSPRLRVNKILCSEPTAAVRQYASAKSKPNASANEPKLSAALYEHA